MPRTSTRLQGKSVGRGSRLRFAAVAGVAAAALAFSVSTAGGAGARTQSAGSAAQLSAPAAASADVTYTTTLNYLIRFYPRYLTSWLEANAPQNRFLAPTSAQDGLLTSTARTINAFNVDTVYASVLNMNVSQGPRILTIPQSTSTFSLLTLDVWGSVFRTPEIATALNSSRKRGWGIKIIESLMDDVRIESGEHGTRIVMRKYR